MTRRVPHPSVRNSSSSSAAEAYGQPSVASIHRSEAARASRLRGASGLTCSTRASASPAACHEQSGSLVCLAPASSEKADESSPTTRWRSPASQVRMSA